MYSHEIEELLKLKNNILTVQEYCNIIATSPQINYIIYKDDLFHINTSDNYKFKIKVRINS